MFNVRRYPYRSYVTDVTESPKIRPGTHVTALLMFVSSKGEVVTKKLYGHIATRPELQEASLRNKRGYRWVVWESGKMQQVPEAKLNYCWERNK